MLKRLCPLLVAALVACGSSTPKPAPPPKVINMEPEVVEGKPIPPADPADQKLALWPEVKKGTLPNGLTYYIMKHGKPEKRAYLWLAVNVGSVDEDDDQRGLAHLDEHMAFNGTKHFPRAADVVDYIEKIGMRFGADLNASTWWHETVYKLVVPTDNPEFMDKGLTILRDWAGDTTYDPVEVDKERGVVLEEWRLGRGAGMRLFDKQSKTVFAGSRYAERITIGLPEIIKGAPRDTLYRFYKDWYRPDLMAVIAVGDVDIAKMEQEIKKRFGDLKGPPNARKKMAAGVPKADGTRVSIETDREATSTRVEVSNIIGHRPKASRRDLRRLTVEEVYSAIMDERFSALRRKADAPFLFASSRISSGGPTREIDDFSRGAQAKEGRVEDALRVVMTEALRAERHGFSQAELDRARTQILRALEQQEARAATLDSRRYVEEILRNFLEDEAMIGPTADKEFAREVLPTITIDDLNAAVKSYGSDNNRVIAISGPDGKPLPTKERVLQILAEVEKSNIPAWEDKPVPTTLMSTAPAPGKIVKEKKIDAINVTEWTLGNGARVVVKPTDFENDTIVLSASSPGGHAIANDKDFRNALFAIDAATAGGVGEFDAETLGKILTGKQMSVSLSIGEVTEGIRASSSQKDLETMFQMLYLRMTAPRKDADQFDVWRNNRAEQITNLERLPEYKCAKQSTEALYNNHPRRRFTSPDDIRKAELDKALAFYKDRFGDVTDFTFVIVGSIELDKLRPLVEQYLASLPGKKRVEKEKDLGIRKHGGVFKNECKAGVEPKARVQIDFHADDRWTKDNERDAQILGRVTSTRLREVLREDMSGVYGVGAFGNVSRSPHQERSFGVQFGCDPKRVEELVAATFTELGKIATAPKGNVDKAGKDKKDLPITDDDLADYLAKVKETFIRERETSMRTNNFWTTELSRAYRYGDDPTAVLDPSKYIARMTPANVRASAKHYFDKKSYYQSVHLPEKDVPTPGPAVGAGKMPAECTDYLALVARLGKCEKLPQAARDAIKQAAESMKAGWDKLTPDEVKATSATCRAAADATKQAAAATGC